MQNKHLIFSGIPASGKSTVARSLSKALAVEMLDKDEILEALFEEKGIGDAEWRSSLSRAADEILRERALQLTSSVLVSWWRHPDSTSNSGTPVEWLSYLPGVLIEVYCSCAPSIAAARFKSRVRHRGHLDQFKSQANLLTEFQQHATLGPLRIGQLIEVNSESSVELTNLMAEIDRIS
jgi:adenylylsulfate kinase-like enzyme